MVVLSHTVVVVVRGGKGEKKEVDLIMVTIGAKTVPVRDAIVTVEVTGVAMVVLYWVDVVHPTAPGVVKDQVEHILLVLVDELDAWTA